MSNVIFAENIQLQNYGKVHKVHFKFLITKQLTVLIFDVVIFVRHYNVANYHNE